MEAMILAAGAGTRLRPLTDTRPKALVEVGGRTLLERVLGRLKAAGARRIIINTHHHQDQMEAACRELEEPGLEIRLSPEPGGPYDTGGGLFAAAPLFAGNAPFLLHNVDILSAIPLAELLVRHGDERARGAAEAEKSGPVGECIASLAVQDREARRRLLFDEVGLVGWENLPKKGEAPLRREARPTVGAVRSMAFTGIHVIEPRIFELSSRTGTFSIIDLYLELAGEGWVIRPLEVTGHPWLDVGTPDRLEEARRRIAEWEEEHP